MKKFFKWLENYWYHYKWVTIAVLFVAIVLGIGVTQMLKKEDTDVRVVYFGPAVVSGEQANEMEFALEQVMKEDYDGDGAKNAQITTLNHLTSEQYQEKLEQAEKDGTFFAYDMSGNAETISQLNTLIGTGDTVICLLDEYIYTQLKEQDAFETLENVLGYKPEQAQDDYSVFIGDTDFGQSYSAFDAIPENTRLCICKMSKNTYFMNKSAIQKTYDRHLDMFRDIFAFTDQKEGE